MTALGFRLAAPDDMGFVISTWLESFKTSRSAGLISMARWWDVMALELADILARPGLALVVACHPGERDQLANLYGWIAVERNYLVTETVSRGGKHQRRLIPGTVPLIAFCYVKAAYRRMGIARSLLAAAGVTGPWNYAVTTPVVAALVRDKKIPAESQWLHLALRHPQPTR